MADRVYWFTVTVAHTNNPLQRDHTPMKFNASTVEEIGVIVPPGPGGSVGFQIWNGGGPFIPNASSQLIIADDYKFVFPQDKAPNNGNWEFVARNNDVIDHTLQVWFAVRDFVDVSVATSGLVGV